MEDIRTPWRALTDPRTPTSTRQAHDGNNSGAATQRPGTYKGTKCRFSCLLLQSRRIGLGVARCGARREAGQVGIARKGRARMGRLRGRLSYANVMATLAVFIALGGAAY